MRVTWLVAMSTSDKVEGIYAPIDCGLYDHLEVFAIHRKPIAIEYNELADVVKLDGVVIETTIIKDGEEFLKLASGEEVRLDKLLVVDGIEFKSNAAS